LEEQPRSFACPPIAGSLVSFSAMAGVVGGGGLGDLAVRYGYERFNTEVMLATIGVLIVLVQTI
jgi:D-methionine transport system permease protein